MSFLTVRLVSWCLVTLSQLVCLEAVNESIRKHVILRERHLSVDKGTPDAFEHQVSASSTATVTDPVIGVYEFLASLDETLIQAQRHCGNELAMLLNDVRLTAPETLILYLDEWRIHRLGFPPLTQLGINPYTLLQQMHRKNPLEHYSSASVTRLNSEYSEEVEVGKQLGHHYRETINASVDSVWQSPQTLNTRELLKHHLQFFLILRRVRLTLRHALHFFLRTLFDLDTIRELEAPPVSTVTPDPAMLTSLTDMFPAACLLELPFCEPCPLHLDWFRFPDQTQRHWLQLMRLGWSSSVTCSCRDCVETVPNDSARAGGTSCPSFTALVHWLCEFKIPAELLGSKVPSLLEHLSLFTAGASQFDEATRSPQPETPSRSENVTTTGSSLAQCAEVQSEPAEEKTVYNGCSFFKKPYPDEKCLEDNAIESRSLSSLSEHLCVDKFVGSSEVKAKTPIPRLWIHMEHPRRRPIICLETVKQFEASMDWTRMGEVQPRLKWPFALTGRRSRSIFDHSLNSETGSSGRREAPVINHFAAKGDGVQQQESGTSALSTAELHESDSSPTIEMETPLATPAEKCQYNEHAKDKEPLMEVNLRCVQQIIKCHISVPPTNIFSRNSTADSKMSGYNNKGAKRSFNSVDNGPPLLLDRYVAVDSEVLLLMVPHETQQYCAYVKEALPVYCVLFCSGSRSHHASLHIDFVGIHGVPDAIPVQFVSFIGFLPGLSFDFEKKVEDVITQGLCSPEIVGIDSHTLKDSQAVPPNVQNSCSGIFSALGNTNVKSQSVTASRETKAQSEGCDPILRSSTTYPRDPHNSMDVTCMKLYRLTLVFDSQSRAMTLQKQIQESFRISSGRILENFSEMLYSCYPFSIRS